MNLITIAGHLGGDPEVRFTSSGKKVTTFRVATRTRKGQNDDTIWWRVTVWGEQFDKMIPYFKKGSPIVVSGEFHKPEMFTDREGKTQISLEITAHSIQFSPFGKPGSSGAEGTTTHHTGSQATSQTSESAPINPYMGGMPTPPGGGAKGSTYDDEVPF